MPVDRIVLDHLLEGRDALHREVQQLTAAIEQLDAALGLLGTPAASPTDGSVSATAPAPAPAAPAPAAPEAPAPITAEPVNPPVEVEAAVLVPERPRVPRKPPAKRSSRPRAAASGEPPKSIRVHVLEMLEAENRDFGLAEIIDRIHDAGIKAHDDAVRSITIKLMKDGQVERVGRGQYRLARRGSAGRAAAPVARTPRVSESAPEPDPLPVATEPVDVEPTNSEPLDPELVDAEPLGTEAPDSSPAGGTGIDDTVEPGSASFEQATPESVPTESGSSGPQGDDAVSDDAGSGHAASDDEAGAPPYTPSLNLGQPWNS